MAHQENSSRELVWIEGQNAERWGCSECAWVFHPSGPPADEQLDEMKRTFKTQLSAEFASHVCAEYPRVKDATPWKRRVG
jgi:rubredoxin